MNGFGRRWSSVLSFPLISLCALRDLCGELVALLLLSVT